MKELKWFEHVQGMRDDRLSKQFMVWYSVGGNKRKGTPKYIWMHEIRGTMRKIGHNCYRIGEIEKICNRI